MIGSLHDDDMLTLHLGMVALPPYVHTILLLFNFIFPFSAESQIKSLCSQSTARTHRNQRVHMITDASSFTGIRTNTRRTPSSRPTPSQNSNEQAEKFINRHSFEMRICGRITSEFAALKGSTSYDNSSSRSGVRP